MTLTPDAPVCWNSTPGKIAGFSLTKHAAGQMEERGIDRDQLATVLINPAYRQRNGTAANDNITVYLDHRTHVITAVLRAGEVEELAVATRKKPAPVPQQPQYVERRRPVKPVAPKVKRSHVLDSIHPALRKEITRLVDGDFSRLVVHSPTNVEIKP